MDSNSCDKWHFRLGSTETYSENHTRLLTLQCLGSWKVLCPTGQDTLAEIKTSSEQPVWGGEGTCLHLLPIRCSQQTQLGFLLGLGEIKLLTLSLEHCSPNHPLLLIINETLGEAVILSLSFRSAVEYCAFCIRPHRFEAHNPGWVGSKSWRVCECLSGSQGTTHTASKLWQLGCRKPFGWEWGLGRCAVFRPFLDLPLMPYEKYFPVGTLESHIVKGILFGFDHLTVLCRAPQLIFFWVCTLRLPGNCKSGIRGLQCICCFPHTHFSSIF